MNTAHKKIAVIGGGITGLAAAFKLQELAGANGTAIECTVFEASNRIGGIIESVTANDCILELGADSFITNKPWALDLVRRLDLEDQIQYTNSRHRRTLIARGTALHPLPEGFRLIAPTDISAFLATPLLSWAGKARVLMDLVILPQQTNNEETVADFAKRRLGTEAYKYIVQPMLGGIYVGNAQRLSLQATMPWIAALEQEYGSIIKGLTASAAERNNTGSGVRYGLFASLKGGLQKLIDALAAQLSNTTVNLNCPVKQVLYNNSKFELQLFNNTTETFDAVILALPANLAGKLTSTLDNTLAQQLSSIEYASSVILNFIYKRAQIPHALDGFGFIVPHIERRSIIACTFSSVKFTQRTADDTTVLRVFMGGSLHPHMIDLDDKLLIKLAAADLQLFLGITETPLCVKISRYKDAMPQYLIGHKNKVEHIMHQAKAFPNLALAGNAYNGVGIPDCIHSGQTAAQQIYSTIYQCQIS